MDENTRQLQLDVTHIRIEVSDMKADIHQLGTQADGTKADVGALRADLQVSIGALRAEMERGFRELGGDIRSLRLRMNEMFESLRVLMLVWWGLAGCVLFLIGSAFK